ncbi:MAG: O-antigen ligase family protein [Pseudomonadota bacterium]
MSRSFYYATLLLIVWLPWPWGSNHEWSTALFAAASFALALWLVSKRPLCQPAHFDTDGQTALRRMAGLWLGLLAYLLFQVLPLPPGLVAVLSPQTCAIVGCSGGWLALSATPDETLYYTVLTAAYGAFFFVCLHALSSRWRIRRALWWWVVSAALMTVYGVLVRYGGEAFEPVALARTNRGSLSGAFVNRNHFAGFVSMAAAMAIGLLLADLRPSGERSRREWLRDTLRLLLSRKVVLRLLIIVLVAGLVLTRSRMGNTAFFSATLMAGIVWFWRSGGSRRVALMIFASFLLVDLYIVGNVVGVDRVVERIEQSDYRSEQRVDVNGDTLRMIVDFPVVGSGAGSYQRVFPAYKSIYNSTGVFHHAHNDYFQFWAELGPLGFLLTGGIAAIAVIAGAQALRRRKSRFYASMALGGLMAVTYMAIHATTDFNLRVTANGALFLLVLALLLRARYTPSR